MRMCKITRDFKSYVWNKLARKFRDFSYSNDKKRQDEISKDMYKTLEKDKDKLNAILLELCDKYDIFIIDSSISKN